MKKGTIKAISISPERGQLKAEVPEAKLIADYGIENDGHAGKWHRQVTLLDWASVQKANQEHNLDADPGDFAENILIDGLDLSSLSIGTRIKLGGGRRPGSDADRKRGPPKRSDREVRYKPLAS